MIWMGLLSCVVGAGVVGFANWLVPSEARAADFFIDQKYHDQMDVGGVINLGDEVKFQQVLNQAAASGTRIGWLRLNSNGGNVVAGAKIAEMTRNNSIQTMVGNNDECASICVLVFAAGTTRSHYETSRIGVHSISTYAAGLNGPGVDDESAMAGSTWLARQLKYYGTPDNVIGKMISTPSADGSIAWLTTNDVVGWSTLYPLNVAQQPVPQYVSQPQYAPQPQYTPAPQNWNMMCVSTANKSQYYVTLNNNGTIQVRDKIYNAGNGHWEPNEAGAWTVTGTTKYGTYSAVLHGPSPRMVFQNNKETAIDRCA
jgi:ATP-dependent protease ClpP protease subunit